MTVTIRPAAPADVPVIFRFIKELAEYEREPQAVVSSEAMIRDALFGAPPAAYALIAEEGELQAGYALYFFNYSTWLGRPGLYLEELYVTPSARGSGIGRTLLSHLAAIAVQRGCGRMEWAVLDWNEPAIEFYRALGATAMDEWTLYRLTGKALEDVARMGTPASG